MTNRIVILTLFTALSAVYCFFPENALNAKGESRQQRPRSKQARRSVRSNRTESAPNSTRDYSKFSHRTNKHKGLACSACHKAPTANWPTVAKFPDVADYPAHEACTRCHRTQFFKGARPVICSVCHTKVSPRAKERFAFEKLNQPSQFGTIFPHDKHQDVLALNGFGKGFESAHAIRRALFVLDEKKYANCTICHDNDTRTMRPEGGFPDGFEPPSGTFKTMPAGHESCFNCHWKNQKPTRENCEGCHKLSDTDIAAFRIPTRLSLKFRHLRPGLDNEHERECTYCHINITGESSLEGLQPDVPINPCARSCHGSGATKYNYIATESKSEKDDPANVCTYCHTSIVGSRPEPQSHRDAP